MLNAVAVDTKIGEVENKISNGDAYVTTQEFNKLTTENFKERLKPADLVSKNDFDNKLMTFNKNITSNKTKYLEIQKKLNSLTTRESKFLLWRMYFICDYDSQNLFVYQSILDTLYLKKTRLLIIFLVENQKGHIIRNLSHYMLLSCIA